MPILLYDFPMDKNTEILVGYILSLEDFEYAPNIDNNYEHMGATIVDGILQSGLNYKNVVKPRVESVLANYSNHKTTSAFLAICAREGIKNIISWKDDRKPDLIIALLFFLRDESIETCQQFSEWLNQDIHVTKLKRMKGIGPKTVDYFKILLGQENIAVDVHLKRFVQMAGIDLSGYDEIKKLIGEAANQINIETSLLDHSIWKYMAERK